MNNNNLISIIVPVYKVPYNLLTKCLDSLTQQKYVDIEIVIVDDGSPDDCGKICEEYAKKDNRIKVIHQENKGLSGARNTGVKNSSGYWISFVDGDDWLEQDTFVNLMKKVDDSFDIILFGTIKDYKYKWFNYTYGNFLKDGKIYTGAECKLVQKELLNFHSNIGDVSARLFRKSLLTDNNIEHDEDIRQGVEAIDFNLRAFEHAKKIIFIEEFYYHYIFNEFSITNYFSEQKCYITLEGYKKIYNYLQSKDNCDELLKVFYLRVIHNIVATAISGFFSPNNKDSYKNKKIKYLAYFNDGLLQETIKNVDKSKIEKKQRLILYLIKHKMFLLVSVLAYIRYMQKNR